MVFKDFQKWVQGIVLLNNKQRVECGSRLNEATDPAGVRGVPPSIAEAVPKACPHCAHPDLQKRGSASGLRRWKCKKCAASFNVLTGTPLARLREKEKWMENAKCMIEGLTVRKTADNCAVHRNTSFRWRHRFLELQQSAQCKDLNGIAESDATYFYYSEKGARTLDREPRKRGGDGIGPGISKALVPVITLRDRTGKGAERVAPSEVGSHAKELYTTHLSPDTLLLTDGNPELCAAAHARNPKAHQALVGAAARGGDGSAFHLQNTNSFHSHLKRWMSRFHGVATKYLDNYVGWHRHLFERTHQNDPNKFILLSFKPLSISNQLTVT